MNRIRVMIIEDSDVVRLLLEEIVRRDPRLEVAASVSNAEDALKLLSRVLPDVISMDVRLPGMNGLQATQRIMSERPTPIVIVSASVEADELKISINALKAGAVAIMEKPVGTTHANYQQMATQLCTQLVIMSEVKVVRQRPGPTPTPTRAPRPPGGRSGAFSALGIATSTGGPRALEMLLGGLPPEFPLPILVVQHIATPFLDGFAAWLDDVSPFAATVACDGERLVPGRIYLPPVDQHLAVQNGRVRLEPGPLVSNQRPSGTVLFRSLARDLGPRAIGVLLTGMGDDGAAGLLELRTAGGYTIGEDESTSVVYGMPQAAARLGAVCCALPLHEIAPHIVGLVAQSAPAGSRNGGPR
jgi:two-component system, chemotaxis family, protein-glutamate methylesterase/glutaminase